MTLSDHGPQAPGAPLLFVATALATAVVFAGTTCGTVFFGDSGELIAAAVEPGVAHPPGYPLYTLLGHLALQLPWGEPAWRMNLLSALFGALACAGVATLVARWTRSTAAAIGAAGSLAFGRTFWLSSVVAEVYTLHLLALVSLLWLAECFATTFDRGARGKLLIGAGVVLGLALAHRPTVLWVVPAAALLAGVVRRRGEQPVRGGARPTGVAWVTTLLAAVAIPMIAYGALMLRSRADPTANWGRPENLERLLAHVTTRSYGQYLSGAAGWIDADHWRFLGRLVWQDLGFIGLPLAVLGLLAAGGADGVRRARRSLAALALLSTLFGLSYGTGDVQVLFLPLMLAAALATGLGVAAVARSRASLAPWLAVLLVLSPLVKNFRACDLRGITAAADYGRDMLGTVPRDGVLFVEGDDAFLLAYLTQVLGERPDLRIYDRNGLMFEDLLDDPLSAPRPGESLLGRRIRSERNWMSTEISAAGRSVWFMSWPGYEPPRGLVFEPVGLFYRVGPAGPSPPIADPWLSYRESAILRQVRSIGDRTGMTIAATYPLMRGERELFEGRRERAVAHFDRAREMAGASESILNYLGAIYGRIGDYRRAEEAFEAAIRARPVSVRAWNNLARARSLVGDLEGALAAMRRSLEIDPNQRELREQLEAERGREAR